MEELQDDVEQVTLEMNALRSVLRAGMGRILAASRRRLVSLADDSTLPSPVPKYCTAAPVSPAERAHDHLAADTTRDGLAYDCQQESGSTTGRNRDRENLTRMEHPWSRTEHPHDAADGLAPAKSSVFVQRFQDAAPARERQDSAKFDSELQTDAVKKSAPPGALPPPAASPFLRQLGDSRGSILAAAGDSRQLGDLAPSSALAGAPVHGLMLPEPAGAGLHQAPPAMAAPAGSPRLGSQQRTRIAVQSPGVRADVEGRGHAAAVTAPAEAAPAGAAPAGGSERAATRAASADRAEAAALRAQAARAARTTWI